MSNFLIVRPGKDSVQDIEKLDALHEAPKKPLLLSLKCKQVPLDLTKGDFALIWLGSDNNQGTPTKWKQGLRAMGRVLGKSGGPKWNDEWQVDLQIGLILPESITREDILANAPVAYYWCSAIPVIGLSTSANQTVQQIKQSDPNQDIRALFYAISAVQPGFRALVERTYPELIPNFNYTPVAPSGAKTATIAPNISSGNESIQPNLPAAWILALAAKGLLLATGQSGTGKSRTARDIARSMDYALEPKFAATAQACRPANCLALVAVGAHGSDRLEPPLPQPARAGPSLHERP